MKHKDSRRMRVLSCFFLLLVALMAVGCSNPSYNEGPFDIDDEELLPYRAMYEVDRSRFCLSAIDKDSIATILRSDSPSSGYDVEVRVVGDDISQSIFFVWQNGRYAWIGEQERHYSGRDYVSPDGELPEQMIISYFEKKTEGGPIGLSISYWGDDKRIPPDSRLTCDLALTYIREWEMRK